jgi:hypothetical protein
VPNVVIVKLGQDGRVRLRNESGAVHLLADVAGWYDASSSGALFRPVNPSRILDTRSRLGTSASAPTTVGPGENLALRVGASRGPEPGARRGAERHRREGHGRHRHRVYPATASAAPEVSNLNLAAGQTAADLVVVKLGNRAVRLRNTAGQVALLADVSGWFGPAS